jgi:hypothetical protein
LHRADCWAGTALRDIVSMAVRRMVLKVMGAATLMKIRASLLEGLIVR